MRSPAASAGRLQSSASSETRTCSAPVQDVREELGGERAVCGMEGRQEKNYNYRHTMAFLWEGVWTKQLSLKKTIMAAMQMITFMFYWGLCKDTRFDNKVESGEMLVANVLTYWEAVETAILSKAMDELQDSVREVKGNSMLVERPVMVAKKEPHCVTHSLQWEDVTFDSRGEEQGYMMAEKAVPAFWCRQIIHEVMKKTSTMEVEGLMAIYRMVNMKAYNVGFSSLVLRGEKITFFGVMKEKTFTKVVEGKWAIYRVEETSAEYGGKQAIYRVVETSAEFGGKQAIYRTVDTKAYNVGFSSLVLWGEKITFFGVMKEKTFTKLVGGKRAIFSVEASADIGSEQAIYVVDIEASTDIGDEGAIYMVNRETSRQKEGRQIISTELVVFDGVAVNTKKTFQRLGGRQISSKELMESLNVEDDNVATFWVVEGRALVEDKFLTTSIARGKSSREFGGNWISAKRFHGDFREHKTFFQVKQSDNQLGLMAVTVEELLCYDKEFVVGPRQFVEGQSEMQDRNSDGRVENKKNGQ